MEGTVSTAGIDAGLDFGFNDLGFAKAPLKQERLPFTVRPVVDSADLAKAVSVRHDAYARHVPALAEVLRHPEPNDDAPGCVVLLAESKLDGVPLGTLRIQTNRHRRLALEDSVALPGELARATLAEATRLGVTLSRAGRLVKTMLFKAFYLACVEAEIDWMVIGARAPLDRMYAGLLFGDVFPGADPVPLKHAGLLPHRILSFDVRTAEERWQAARHPMFELFFRTAHPDLRVDGAAALLAAAQARPEALAGLAA